MSKTVLLGFPKSGTSSFHELFTKLNRKSAHWRYGGGYIGSRIYTNKEKGRPLLSGLYHFDDITQMDVCVNDVDSHWPQLTDFRQIYNENPRTIFILNKRDPYKILNSLKKWVFRSLSFHKRMFRYNPELFVGIKGGSEDEKIINLIEGHYLEVEKFYSSTSPAHFISFDIERDTTEKLTSIDTAIKNISFPHANKLWTST